MIARLTGYMLCAVLSMSSIALAQCISTTVDVPKEVRGADLVFTGILLKNDAQTRLTFRADRVWKGRPTSRDIIVYVLGEINTETYSFQEGQMYFMPVRVLSANDRVEYGVGPIDPPAFSIPRSCGWPLASPSITTQLDKIAKSRKPPSR